MHKSRRCGGAAHVLIIVIVLSALAATLFGTFSEKIKSVFTRPKAAGALKQLKILEVIYLPPDSLVDPASLASKREQVRYLVGRASAYKDGTIQTIDVTPVVPEILRPKKRFAITGDSGATLYQILNEPMSASDPTTICDYVVQNGLDQVWLWVDPTVDPAPGEEKVLVTTLSNYSTFGLRMCSHDRSFIVMGFDVTRNTDQALHSFGHMMELFMEKIQGYNLVVERFMGGIYGGTGEGQTGFVTPISNFPLSERCGTIHVPPNGVLSGSVYTGTQWNNTNSVQSACDDWKPDGSGTKTSVNNSNWNSLNYPQIVEPEGKFALWWLQRLPNIYASTLNFNGGSGAVYKPLPNWWDFLVDTDTTINYYKGLGYWMSESLVIPPILSSYSSFKSGVSGTTTTWTHTNSL